MAFVNIKPCTLFKEFDKTIFDYPKWKHLIPADPTQKEFNNAWQELFNCDYEDCTVDYGRQEIMGNKLGSVLTITTPHSLHFRGGFGEYTDDPVLRDNQWFYYIGAGCTWSVDAIGQRFRLIDSVTALPVDWQEVYNWEIIGRYKPFVVKLFK